MTKNFSEHNHVRKILYMNSDRVFSKKPCFYTNEVVTHYMSLEDDLILTEVDIDVDLSHHKPRGPMVIDKKSQVYRVAKYVDIDGIKYFINHDNEYVTNVKQAKSFIIDRDELSGDECTNYYLLEKLF